MIDRYKEIAFFTESTIVHKGKQRRIWIPNQPMRMVHKDLRERIRMAVDTLAYKGMPHYYGLIRVKWHRQLLRHRNSRYFYALDLAHAYDSIDGDRLTNLLDEANRDGLIFDWELGKVPPIREFLDRFCLNFNGGLATGAPMSPHLFNMYAGWYLDRPLRAIAKKYRLIYTRYMDDLTFSSRHKRIGIRVRRAINQVIREVGFTVNRHKIQICDLRTQGPLVITGIGLRYNPSGEPSRVNYSLARTYLDRVRGTLHRVNQLARIDDHTKNHVNGLIGAFIHIIGTDPTKMTRKQQKIWQGIQEFWNKSRGDWL